MTQNAPIPVASSANLIIPTHIDASRSLTRTHLLRAGPPEVQSKKRVIVVEAQAGQGKSTLALQFIENHDLECVWHRFTEEDSNPFCALTSILQTLKNSIPNFSSPQLKAILATEQRIHPDFRDCANILLRDIALIHPTALYIVFDDLHRITDNSLTNILVEEILDNSPKALRFFLLSRKPLNIKARILQDSQVVRFVKNSDLALTAPEIEALFCNTLQQPICRQEAGEIHALTEGWLMGIILAAHPASGRGKFWLAPAEYSPLPVSGRNYLMEYIQDEIYTQISEEFRISFQKLALLDEIPADLAQIITETRDICNVLSNHSTANAFVYRLDEQHSLFRLHRFFRDFLRIRARGKFSQKEIADIHNCAAEYYLNRKKFDTAMLHYKKAGNYKKLEKILKEGGLALVARNETAAIHTLLRTIPEDTLFQFGWLTLFAGLLQLDYTPRDTLRYFESARAHFIVAKDETGELLALSLIIYYHSVVAGCCKSGTELLLRAESLLLKNDASLSVHVRTMAAGNLALGLFLFNSEVEKAREFSSMAIALACKYSLENFAASSRFVQGYIELLSGDLPKFKKEAELCYRLLSSPNVSWSNKLTIRMIFLCHLSMSGDQLNFSAEKQQINTTSGKRILNETVIAPYLYIWESSNLFSIGETDRAMELLHRGLGSTLSATTDHMHSQLLQWHAFGHALRGEHQEALTRIIQSTELRAKTGSPFHEGFNAIIAGAVYSRLGMSEFADYSFARGVEIAEALPSSFLQICAYLNRSFHNLVVRGPLAALEDLREGLGLMKRHGFNHFWTWEPAMMIRLLSLAVQHNIEYFFAKELSLAKLDTTLTDTGTLIPLLHISLLDNFQICINHRIIFKASNFTPSQRELLGFLLAARGQRISQEQLQLELWPDKPPEKARTSFDTLLNRLRGEFANKISGSRKTYLSMQKGILELDNSRIDTVEFSRMALTGLQHSRNGQWWLAECAFRKAVSFWKGLWPEESFCNDLTTTLTDQLKNSLLDVSLTWAENLTGMNKTDKAIDLLEHTLPAFQDERPIRLLYSLYVKTDNYLKAGDTLDRYRTALGELGYSTKEIEELLAADPLFTLKRRPS